MSHCFVSFFLIIKAGDGKIKNDTPEIRQEIQKRVIIYEQLGWEL